MCATRRVHRSVSEYHDESDHKETDAFVRSKRKSIGKPGARQAHSTDVFTSVPAPATSRLDQTKDDVLPGAIPLATFRRPRSYSRRRPSTADSHNKDNNIGAGSQRRRPRQPTQQEPVTVGGTSVHGSVKDLPSEHVYERPRSYSRRRPIKNKSTAETSEPGNKTAQQSSRAHQRIAQKHERVGSICEQMDKTRSVGMTLGNPKLPEPEKDRSDRQPPSQPSDVACREVLGQSVAQHTGKIPTPAPVTVQEKLAPGILQNESGLRLESSTKPSRYQSRAETSNKVAQQPKDPALPIQKGKGRDQGRSWKGEMVSLDDYHVINPDSSDRGLPKPSEGKERELDHGLRRDTLPLDNFHIIHPAPSNRLLVEEPKGKERELDHEPRHAPHDIRPNRSSRMSALHDQPTQIRAALQAHTAQERGSFERSSRRAEDGRRARRARPPPETKRARPAGDVVLSERPRTVAFTAPPVHRGRYRDSLSGESSDDGREKWVTIRGRSGKPREAQAH